MIAYLARFGHQPYSELAAMPVPRLRRFARALSDIMQEYEGSATEDED